MSFLGETILLPIEGDKPDNFAFFKVIEEEIPRGTQIYVTRKDHISPVFATVIFSYVYDNYLLFLIQEKVDPYRVTRHRIKDYSYSVNTRDHYIIEVEPVEGEVINPRLENIDDEKEDELIQAVRNDHSLSERINQVLWDRPSFKRKMKLEKDKETIKSVDSIGKSTGMVDFHKIPDYLLPEIHSYLGKKEDTSTLEHARERKKTRTARVPAQENTARTDYFSRFRRMFGRGTRKNKGKRYGRL